MREQKANSGEIIEVRPAGSQLKTAQIVTLIQTRQMQVMQLEVPAGMTVPLHRFPGETIIHCLEGRVAVMFVRENYEVRGGQLVYCSSNEAFSLRGIQKATLMMTVALPGDGTAAPLIG